MVTIKSPAEIKIIKEGGKKLSRILKEIVKFCRAGVTTEEIDKLAEKLIFEAHGEPAFRGYHARGAPPFPSVICVSINNEVVHAPATPARVLKDGDVVGLDIGMRYPTTLNAKRYTLNAGLYTDMAATIGVGKISREANQLIKVTREALSRGFQVVRPGNFISDIGREIQDYVNQFKAEPEALPQAQHGLRARNKYGIVRDLVGHGVGYKLHEDPPIPNYFDSRMPATQIKEGMVLAIEPMIVLGSGQVDTLPDKWTIVTSEGGLAAHFEVTVVVTKRGYEIATPLP